jgi:hypothetical protein
VGWWGLIATHAMGREDGKKGRSSGSVPWEGDLAPSVHWAQMGNESDTAMPESIRVKSRSLRISWLFSTKDAADTPSRLRKFSRQLDSLVQRLIGARAFFNSHQIGQELSRKIIFGRIKREVKMLQQVQKSYLIARVSAIACALMQRHLCK